MEKEAKKMVTREQINDVIKTLPFPTPKNVMWILRQQGFSFTEEDKKYTWQVCKMSIENLIADSNSNAKIAVYHKFLKNNYKDEWGEEQVSDSGEKVNVVINTSNESGNKI